MNTPSGLLHFIHKSLVVGFAIAVTLVCAVNAQAKVTRNNTIITDLQFESRNAHGMVEDAATFTLVKPVDLAKANGVLLYAVPNRGNRISIPAFSTMGSTTGSTTGSTMGSVAGESGDEFFLKRGYTKKAVEGLLHQHFLLPEDAERLIRQAEESNVLR